ncbi:MAG: DUF4829 domain-containing protein [Actinomycetota bacterium]|nr:DUF4829 domain-containing protein [Actinomycetota bacterium]
MSDICNVKLVFIITVLMVILSGCSETSSLSEKSGSDAVDYAKNTGNRKKQKAIEKDTEDSKSSVFQITDKDIEEARSTIEKHFKTMTDGDIEGFKETLGRYKEGFANQENIKEEFRRPKRYEVKSISYPGKYQPKDKIPGSYTDMFQREPYKVLVLHAVFEIYDRKKLLEKNDWDYILIRETKNDSWLIHDWGH